MSIKNEQIQGSVSIGRNLSVGGKATVNGDMQVGHNLRVLGWLEADNIKSGHKGFYSSVGLLKNKYPNPKDGWIAGVGTNSPFALYAAEGGEWVNTGGTIDADLVCKSAYDVAVDNGFIGTEKEWLMTLIGKKGADAEIVKQFVDEDGNTIITWADGKTTVVKRGRKGDDGYTPIKGVDYWTPEDAAAVDAAKKAANDAADRANDAADNAYGATSALKEQVEAEITKLDGDFEEQKALVEGGLSDISSYKEATNKAVKAAEDAADHATNSATNADEAAANAIKAKNELTQRANEDHQQSVRDQQTVAGLINRAESQTAQVNTALARADADHRTAGSDHATAVADHNTANADHTNVTTNWRREFEQSQASRAAEFNKEQEDREAGYESEKVARFASFNEEQINQHETFENAEAERDKIVAEAVSAIPPDAPSDGKIYGRKDGEWVEVGSVEPVDEQMVYGVRHYYNQPSTILERFSLATSVDLHKTLPVQSLMRRCLVDYNGNLLVYLDHNNSLLTEDGEDATDIVQNGVYKEWRGDIYVEIPTHYRRHRTVINRENDQLSYYETAISLEPFDGAFRVNKCYIGAYEAQLNNNMFYSTCDPTKVGGRTAYDGALAGYRTMKGKAATTWEPNRVHYYATANLYPKRMGLDWNIYMTVCWLYYVEYANLDAQAEYIPELTASGHRQGGLGIGASFSTSTSMAWNDYNGGRPWMPCGVTNVLGNRTGLVDYDVPKDDNGNVLFTAKVPSYRGIENIFGHLRKLMDGVLVVYDEEDGAMSMWVSNTPESYSWSKNDSYRKVMTFRGLKETVYMSNIVRDKYGTILPGVFDSVGSDDSYFCDTITANNNTSGTYYIGQGGVGTRGGGLSCFVTTNTATGAVWSNGTRLCALNPDSEHIIEDLA